MGSTPIDHFFRTLADAQGEHSIGIILSGTGSDGTLGLTRIKEARGLVIVQELDDAIYDSMPHSAIATGMVDLILPIEAMLDQLMAYTSITPQLAIVNEESPLPESQHALLHHSLVQLRTQTGRLCPFPPVGPTAPTALV